MGGKKGPEKNRKYEKDRRDRFNDQFNELNKLLPDFDSSAMKFSKAEIINRTIQYLKDTQSHRTVPSDDKLNDEVSESKINELQKKVAGLLQIIKELVKLLHKSNINFPASLPIDDFKAFKEAYLKCKRKLKESSENKNKKRKTIANNSSEDTFFASGNESIETEDEEKTEACAVTTSSTESVPIVSDVSTSEPKPQTNGKTQIVNGNSSNLLHVDANPVIIPQGNVLTVNGLQNALLNTVNTSPTILLNKTLAVPTLILMQNNILSATTVPQINSVQEKLIVPKSVVNTTNTTFMNKKPIPAVRPYKSILPSKDTSEKIQLMKRKRIRRSKGILVKYPKRKPPSKNKRKEKKIETMKKMNSPTADTTDKRVENTKLETCNSASNSFPQNSNEMDKNYTDNLFDPQVIQNHGQFMDFFENTSRNVNNNGDSSDVNAVAENSINSESTVNCDIINSEASKEPVEQPQSNKIVDYLPPKSYTHNESSMLRNEITSLNKSKCTEKDISPLSIQCNLNENKSVAKDLNLTFDDKAKHYEPSFDEFSNDLFLHVPSSGHHTDSISPTAAFLSNFPLVSSLKHADLLPEHEEDSNTAATNSTTILQIGNLESPSTLLFTNKNIPNRDTTKNTEKEENYTFCNATSEMDNRPEKKKDCKEATPRDIFNLDTFVSQPAKPTACSKDILTQNMPLYPTSTSSSFSTYSRFTKYNDIPVVTSSYYTFSSPPTFPISKTSSDLVTDYNSWVPAYSQDDPNKEKKRDKSISSGFRNTFDLPVMEVSTVEKNKLKKQKQNGSRALVNWMTSPDSRNTSETLQPFSDIFSSNKDDTTISSIGFLNSPNVQNSTNFTSYSTTDYFLDNQSYGDTQLTNKITYSSTNPTSYSWSPSKTTLPTLSMDTPNIMIPSTLPTLVGDLALGNNTFNSFESIPKKGDAEKKKNCQKTSPQSASSFFSVTQLVDIKSMSKKSNDTCQYDENRDKCFKDNYNASKMNENVTVFKKTYASSTYKESAKTNFKCRKESGKCNSSGNQTNRCLSKENKKDNRIPQKVCEYSSQSCQMVTDKDTNSLSNKNSNYSAEALIGSNNHSNTCSTQNYFPYDNSTNYNNCAINKKLNETDSLTNVGYYTNANIVYPNNFQTFNNYSLSNQYCNNYSSQVQQSSFHKKKDDTPQTKQDTSWSYKDNFSSYSSIVPSEFTSSQQKEKYKQPFSNKYNCGQKSSTTYNSYYQYGSSSGPLNHSKSCTFNSSTHSFGQAEQQCSINNYQSSGYDMKSNRNVGPNTNNVGPPTTLTNFNLSTIIPEINDKNCMQSRVTTVGNEKNNFKYGGVNEMNYNYLIQPATETNSESTPLYSASSLQVSHYPDFVNRKHQK